jgi:hypothetical protein
MNIHRKVTFNIIDLSLPLETYRNIYILVPPRIISHSPENMRMTVREGRSARFSCLATGHPVPTIIWHFNGLSRPGIVSTGR